MERPGKLSDRFELISMADRNCSCEFEEGFKVEICLNHQIVSENLIAADRLLFMRWMRERLIAEEFMIQPTLLQKKGQEDDNSNN